MIERLPLASPFLPSELRWRIADARVSGPTSFGLPPATVTTDGGGYWIAELGQMRAATDGQCRSLRGMASRLRGGVLVDVPYLEQVPTGSLVMAPFSDGTTYSDGTEEVDGLIAAHLVEAVGLRDWSALVQVTAGPGLKGSDVFSVFRSVTAGTSMHLCEWIEEEGPGLWRVEIAPQFRQDFPAGTALNFNDPHQTMRLEDPEGAMWPKVTRSWIARPSATFVEPVR